MGRFLNRGGFKYPDKQVVEATKATTNSYTHPLIKVVFWDRYKKAFYFLRENKKRYNHILEIGCYYGLFLPSLCEISDKVIGTDIDYIFNFCKDKTLFPIKQKYSNLELKIADATRLTEFFNEESCDVIIAFSVLEHIEEKKMALNEIYKCLRPGGIFICELPSENLIYKLGRKIVRYSDTHEDYDYTDMRKTILQNFSEVKSFNSPFGIPLFKISAYQKNY